MGHSDQVGDEARARPGEDGEAVAAHSDQVGDEVRARPGEGGPALPRAVVDRLAAAGVPAMTDPAVLAGVGTDWTGRWSGPVLGLVRPRTTEQVAQVLAITRSAGVPVQVQGGNTGLVGGSVPDRPALVLASTAMDRIDPVDRVERTVLVGAGATAGAVGRRARAAGLVLGVDLAARDSATIGGMVATNAGGIGVLAHGMMREQVRGVRAVLADGRVVRSTGRPRKDNAGYDLTQLLVGSEGTLGVITQVELVLHPDPGGTSVGLLAADSLAGAVAAARAVGSGGGRLLAAEAVDAQGVARVAAARGLPDPVAGRARWLLLVEVADGGTGEGLSPVADDVVAVAVTAPDRARLWSYREGQTEAYAALAGPRVEKLDVSVRLDRLDALVGAVEGCVGGVGDVGVFGHALDGNLHVQVVPAGAHARVPGQVVEAILSAVAGLGGAISAEHGIGRAKARYLGMVRSADEIAWMRQLRASVDPDGLLNPGVMLA